MFRLNYCTAAENGFSGPGRIVNGQEVAKGSWPSIARLFLQTQVKPIITYLNYITSTHIL